MSLKQNIIDLSYAARSDESKYRELINEINKMTRKANKSLLQLEKNDINSQAYKAASYMVKRRFDKDKVRFNKAGREYREYNKVNLKKATRYALELSNFLSLKTRTLRGYKESIDRTIDNLGKKYGAVEDKTVFEEFLKSEFFKEFVEKKSDEVMNFGIDKIETTDDLEKLDEIYQRYKKGEIYAADIMDDWEKIE